MLLLQVARKRDAKGVLIAPALDVYERRTNLLGIHLRCVSEQVSPTSIHLKLWHCLGITVFSYDYKGMI